MTLTKKLSQPYPLSTFNEAVKKNLLFSVFLTLFLLIFRPFGLDVYRYADSYLIAGYGLVTFLTILLNDYITAHFLKHWFNEEKWKVYKQMLYALWVLLFLGVTNYAYAFLIDAFPGTVVGFLKVQLYVVLSSIVPVTIVVLWRQNHLLKKNLQQAKQFTTELPVKEEPVSLVPSIAEPEISFTGENNKDRVSISRKDLLYIVSKENYIEIVWQKSNKTEKALLRSTLTKAEEILSGDPYFFRSHRAYLVNLEKVKVVEGNAQGYRLTLEGVEDTVPVARGRASALHEALNALT
jgi:DNA-binding LytR/AlgR family response regulator